MTLELPTRVSVVVPTRDRPALLREALASIRRLEGSDLSFEILVGDNGRDGETKRAAEAYGARWIRVPRPGASAARNAALAAATAEFVAFLDDDDVWLPGHIRPQLALLQARPEYAAVVGQVQRADGELRPFGNRWPEAAPTDGNLVRLLFSSFLQIGALVARTNVRESVGRFSEELISSEDWDWQLRLAIHHPVGFVPQLCVYFRQRRPTDDDAMRWERWPYVRRVFLRNLRRAGERRPPLPFLGRSYLRLCGAGYGWFVNSAAEHARDGERSAARLELGRAVRVSPLHAAHDLLRPSVFRHVAGAIIAGS